MLSIKKCTTKITSILLAAMITASSAGAGITAFAEEQKAEANSTGVKFESFDQLNDEEFLGNLTEEEFQSFINNITADSAPFQNQGESLSSFENPVDLSVMSEDEIASFAEENSNGYLETSDINFLEGVEADTAASSENTDAAQTDENGTYGGAADVLRGGITAAAGCLCKMDISGMASWATGGVFDLIFGKKDDPNKKQLEEIKKALEEIKAQLDVINKKLDKILAELEKIQKEQQVTKMKTDLLELRKNSIKLSEFVEIAQKLSIFDKNSKKEQKQADYEYLFKNYPTIKQDVVMAAKSLYTPGTMSNRPLFYNLQWLVLNNSFMWEDQQQGCYASILGMYMAPYINTSAIVGCMLGYKLNTLDKNSNEYRQKMVEFRQVVANAKTVNESMKKYSVERVGEDTNGFLFSNQKGAIPIRRVIRTMKNKETTTKDGNFAKNPTNWQNWLMAKEDIKGTKTYALDFKYYTTIITSIMKEKKAGKIKEDVTSRYFNTTGHIDGSGGFSFESGAYLPLGGWNISISGNEVSSLHAERELDNLLKGSRDVIGDISSAKMKTQDRACIIFQTADEKYGYNSPLTIHSGGKILSYGEAGEKGEIGSIFSQPMMTIAIVGGILIIAAAITTPIIIKKRKKDNEI